jgi:hypothetical protein
MTVADQAVGKLDGGIVLEAAFDTDGEASGMDDDGHSPIIAMHVSGTANFDLLLAIAALIYYFHR